MASEKSPAQNDPSRLADTEFDFTPVVNGVDFLRSAIDNLLASGEPRNLKYAVLHLQAAVEILIKVRLQREGNQHIFEDPYSADENKLKLGQFRSVTMSAALRRLDKVAGIRLSKKEETSIDLLSAERNKLQHFGSTSKRIVVNARAGHALEVLYQFIVDHLVPNAPEAEVVPLEEAESLIREALRGIESAAEARLARIEPELEAWPSVVIHCPDCEQLAWLFEPYGESRCLFCGRNWSEVSGSEAAEEYAWSILGESRYEAATGRGGWSMIMCPECDDDTFATVATRRNPNGYTDEICFECGFIADGPTGSCDRCGRTTVDPDRGFCHDCIEDIKSRD